MDPEVSAQIRKIFQLLQEVDTEVKDLETLITTKSPPTSPCDLCVYNPPSSCDGKPCSFCVAEGVPT